MADLEQTMHRKPSRVTACLLLAFAGLAVAPYAFSGSTAGPGEEASIPFADKGGIRTWEVVDDSTLLIQDAHGAWYRASVMGPAFMVPTAESIGFATSPSGRLEKSSSIIVHGKRYPVISLTRSDPPPKEKRPGRPDRRQEHRVEGGEEPAPP